LEAGDDLRLALQGLADNRSSAKLEEVRLQVELLRREVMELKRERNE
jgi:hypothetical protein